MKSNQLGGITIVVTRSQKQQSQGRALLQNLGAKVLDLPALEITPPDNWGPLDNALSNLQSFHWLIFSSTNGVQAIEDRLQIQNKSLANCPPNLKIAAVGKKTAHHLQAIGKNPDFVPPNFIGESLIENFPVSGYGLRILLPRVQSGGRTILAEQFRAAGASVNEVAAYESRCPKNIPLETATAIGNNSISQIAFCSGKTVKHTAKLMKGQFGENWISKFEKVKLITIGPETSKACKKYFSKVDQEAKVHDIEGLVNACRLANEINT